LPGHFGICGNEFDDSLARSTSSLRCPPSNLIPWTDFCPVLKIHSYKLWSSYWSSLPTNFSSWYRRINPSIPSQPWFNNLNINIKIIVSFSHLRISTPFFFLLMHINYPYMTPLFVLFITPRLFAISLI